MSLLPFNISEKEYFEQPLIYHVMTKRVNQDMEQGEHLYNIYDITFMIQKFTQQENFELLCIFNTTINDPETIHKIVYYKNINDDMFINEIT